MSLARKSPSRGVVSVIPQGAWGSTSYLHLLTCGHSLSRARASKGPVRCVKCYEPPSDFADEREVQVCQSRLAGALGVGINDVSLSVDATSGTLRLKGATVWLGDEQVRKLLSRRTSAGA